MRTMYRIMMANTMRNRSYTPDVRINEDLSRKSSGEDQTGSELQGDNEPTIQGDLPHGTNQKIQTHLDSTTENSRFP